MIDVIHICVAMKPIEGNFAENAIEHGVCGLNIDGCRVYVDEKEPNKRTNLVNPENHSSIFEGTARVDSRGPNDRGRWPANVILDGSDEVTEQFPYTKSGKPCGIRHGVKTRKPSDRDFNDCPEDSLLTGFGDEGSAARFFYEVKGDNIDGISE